MRIALALFTSIILLFGYAAPASAEDCETIVYAGVYSDYAFQDLGVLVDNRPSAQAGATRTCGKLSYDVWTSTVLSSESPYGNRGGGDELNFTVTWSDTIESPAGTLEVEVSGAYWLLADFGRSRDDIVVASLKVGRPVNLGNVTVTPYVQVSEWIGLDGDYRTTLVRTGLSANLSLSEQWSVDVDVSHVEESFEDTSTWRSDLSLTRTLKNGWSVTGSALMAERMPTVYGITAARSF